MKRRLAAVLLLGLAALGALSAAAQEEPSQEALVADWQQRLDDAQEGLRAAREHVQQAELALGDARQRRRPRGELLGKLYDELPAAREDLAQREAQWPALLEEARRAGVPPVVLREYED